MSTTNKSYGQINLEAICKSEDSSFPVAWDSIKPAGQAFYENGARAVIAEYIARQPAPVSAGELSGEEVGKAFDEEKLPAMAWATWNLRAQDAIVRIVNRIVTSRRLVSFTYHKTSERPPTEKDAILYNQVLANCGGCWTNVRWDEVADRPNYWEHWMRQPPAPTVVSAEDAAFEKWCAALSSTGIEPAMKETFRAAFNAGRALAESNQKKNEGEGK